VEGHNRTARAWYITHLCGRGAATIILAALGLATGSLLKCVHGGAALLLAEGRRASFLCVGAGNDFCAGAKVHIGTMRGRPRR